MNLLALPVDLQILTIKFLDKASRRTLRLCSKHFKYVIDKHHLILLLRVKLGEEKERVKENLSQVIADKRINKKLVWKYSRSAISLSRHQRFCALVVLQ